MAHMGRRPITKLLGGAALEEVFRGFPVNVLEENLPFGGERLHGLVQLWREMKVDCGVRGP